MKDFQQTYQLEHVSFASIGWNNMIIQYDDQLTFQISQDLL